VICTALVSRARALLVISTVALATAPNSWIFYTTFLKQRYEITNFTGSANLTANKYSEDFI